MIGSTRDVAWWEHRGYGALLALFCAVPLLWPAIPPLSDLPGHLALYHIANELPTSPELQRFYGWRWDWIGNLGGNLLMVPLGKLFGVELGAKLMMVGTAVGTAAAFLGIARLTNDRLPATAAFALPLVYNYSFHFGFVNYSVAMALACGAFILWVRLGRSERWLLRTALFLPIATLVWLGHAIAWMLLVFACAGAELHRLWAARTRPLVAELVRSAASGLPLLSPLVISAIVAPGAGGTEVAGVLMLELLAKGLATVLRDRWVALDVVSAAALWGVVALAALRLFRLRLNGPTIAAAAMLGVLYIAIPQTINGSGFLSVRIIPFALAFALLAIDTSAMSVRAANVTAMLALAFLLARMGANTASLLIYDRTYAAQLTAVEHMPQHARVAGFVAQPCPGTRVWGESRLVHLPGLVAVRRDGLVNSHWAIPGLHLLTVRPHDVGSYGSDPSEVVTVESCDTPGTPTLDEAITGLPRSAFDYVWLLDVPGPQQPLAPWLEPVWRGDNAVLYRITPEP